MIADLQPLYPELERSLTIEWPSLSRIALPDFALYTVFKNLLENALLHAQAKSISIAMLHEVLIIHDDGQSLKIEDMQYLGQRFWRKSAQQNGHGLGLSLVKTVLNKYGYQIQFTAAQPQGLSIHISPAAS